MNSRTFRLGLVLALGIVATAAAHNQMVARGRGGSGSAAATTPATAGVATSGPMQLYVDLSTGNNGNTCADPASPCQTPQGAADKVPATVRHPVDIWLDGGAVSGFSLVNHTFDAADAGAGAYIIVHGAPQIPFVVATGLADGGVKSVATDAVGFHVITDTQNALTSNDAETRFLTLIGGTGAGQSLPIISNTATAITVAGAFSPAPIAGTVYAITTPATTIDTQFNLPATSGVAAGTPVLTYFANLWPSKSISNATGASSVQVSDITFSSTAANHVRAFNAWGVELLRVRESSANGNTAVVVGGAGSISILKSALKSSGSSILTATSIASASTQGLPVGAGVYVSGSYISGTNNTVLMNNTSGALGIASSEIVNVSGSAAAAAINIPGSSPVFLGGSRLRCTSTGSGLLLAILSNVTTQPRIFASSGTNSIDSCAIGVKVEGPTAFASFVGSTMTFLSNTTAVQAKGGGRITFNGAVPAFTTNTNDIDVDGVVTARAAFLLLTPNSVVNANYLTTVFLQP